MPELTIRFALEDPPFMHSFAWAATEAEFKRLVETQQQLADSAGIPLIGYLGHAIARAPRYLIAYRDDPVMQRGTRAAIVAYALQCPTGDAERPGLIGDYVGAYDLEVTFTSISVEGSVGTVACTVRAVTSPPVHL
jgi:hypothetical protein